MPPTRGRTSAMRVAATRPGSSFTTGSASGVITCTLTWGGGSCCAATGAAAVRQQSTSPAQRPGDSLMVMVLSWEG
ncbi:hypothetical protein MR829_04540 [Paracoccus versutus]|uniref:hypothetical protein n=1 Tax=Paracoccus versutus TaxID=34007 RepID=UPI001FB8363B|nr:hypothetical protein [Paracoccus versutus]MCJ1899642.1 hypothetical protein [Paracoccus versutus]